jgi:hypothetical protein
MVAANSKIELKTLAWKFKITLSFAIHHLYPGESRTKVDTIPREQTLIQKNEVWFAKTNEFQGRQTIRSDDDLIVCLLRKHLTICDKSLSTSEVG